MNKTLFMILFNFVTGTLCLMYGVRLLSKGLEMSNMNFIKKVLSACTGRLIPAFLSGTVITALVQSSAAVMVITIGLVNAGLMKLPQAVGVICGANIGTTATAQLMSLKVPGLAFPLLAAGLLMRLLARGQALRNLSGAVLGLGFLFTGINILNSGVPYMKESKFVYDLFMNYGGNPYIGLIIGMITTMLVQSSTATVGVTIVLFNAGLISFDAAVGLTLGDNIGTCITAQLAAIGTSIHARRTAWAHTLYNIIGVLTALALLKPFTGLIRDITAILGQDVTKLVANTHTVFNVLSAAVFLPLTGYYVKFIEWIIPEVH